MSQLLQRAHLLYEQNRYPEALQACQRALTEDPVSPEIMVLQGLTLIQLDRPQEALVCVREAITLAPDWNFAHFAHSQVLEKLKRKKLAMQAIEESIRLDPDFAPAYCQQAHLYENLEQWPNMLESAEQALAIDPENDYALNLRAMALKRLGRKKEAEMSLDSAMAKNPDDAFTHANQGWLALERSQQQKALEHFREALRLEPQMDWARQGIVEALKSRHFIYRMMLGFFFWMLHFSPRMRVIIIVGAWLIVNTMSRVKETLGPLAVFVTPLMYAYFVFVLMTWIANPLFNLILRLDHYGRLALDRRQNRQANWLAVCLLSSVGFAVAYAVTQEYYLFVGIMASLLLAVPVTTIFETERGRYRNGMALFSLVLAGLAGYYIGYGMCVVGPEGQQLMTQSLRMQTEVAAAGLVNHSGSIMINVAEAKDLDIKHPELVAKLREFKELKSQFLEKKQAHENIYNLFLGGILLSCFLPNFLPVAQDHNEVVVRMT